MTNIMLKLKKISSSKKIPINDLRIIVALERIVARLESDPDLSKHIIFKGGFVLLKTLSSLRFTRDIDALANGMDKNKVIESIPRAIEKDLKDGLWYGDINVQMLEGQGAYGGVRFDCAFQIDKVPRNSQIKRLSRIHLDVGFGDIIPKNIKPIRMNDLLETEKSISWAIYPLEFIFSEKLQTTVERDSVNSRAKDIFDLVILYKAIMDKNNILFALNNTFQNRGTQIPHSFAEYLKIIDTDIVKLSWNSVELTVDNIDFESTWQQLIKIAEELDNLRTE
ncbi:MAG: nucleotidyl transferase AbiEii/AbiGii toxin family protein [Proteobacteria bacterium]|nr:nucleotidyl transferase AbiEii/AbiGii toxin family protein [Pseudomonadota bacterium]